MSAMVAPVESNSHEWSPVRIGVLAPLERPGWVEAGRHLVAGCERAVAEANSAGGVNGRPVELLVRDTAADPERAAAAVQDLAAEGVVALAGEYHSVVARAVASRAADLGMPFLCSSAVLDALTDEDAPGVARLAPAQSHGWRIYAEFLLAQGHRRIAVASQSSVYWSSGTRLLRSHMVARGAEVIELDADQLGPTGVCQGAAASGASALLLLVGHPDPAVELVRAVRADPRLAGVLLGAPAGQPEFGEWTEELGADGAGIPFLRYLPLELGPVGRHVAGELGRSLGEPPSFVAFEGFDTITVLVEAMRACGTSSEAITQAWPRLTVAGSRGPIRFSRVKGISVWQWAWAPVQVVERDPSDPQALRVLHLG
ncbi:MAG: ABC transporter substrate-binding protein [Nocardioides sp.]|uniref:ABC transporter substrate-binding protein n=1 Tax=Nocardioides sp. TaxID=35761 RepID=UPI003EFD4D24